MNYNNENRRVKAEKTKQKIVESATYLFQTKGYQTVSVDAIVSHAKVSKGAFYQYFESKNTLLVQLIIQNTMNTDQKYADFLQGLSPKTSCKGKILAFTDKISDILTLEVGITPMRILYQAQMSEPDIANIVSGSQRTLYKLIAEVLTEGQRKGEIVTRRSPIELAKYLMTAFHGITFEYCMLYPNYDYKKQMHEIAEFFLEGI